jgi:hypothetical protein
MVAMRKMKLKSGNEIWVEVEETPGEVKSGLAPASRDKQKGAVGSFEEALGTIGEIAEEMQAALARMSKRPEEVTLELGVKFSVSGGVIIARGGLDTSLKLTLGWKNASPASG